MPLPKAATFILHDHGSDCFVTGFCEARCSLRSGNAPQKLASEGSRRPRESINHRSLSTPSIAGNNLEKVVEKKKLDFAGIFIIAYRVAETLSFCKVSYLVACCAGSPVGLLVT